MKTNKIFKFITSMLIITVLFIMPCGALAYNPNLSNDDSIIMESGKNNFEFRVEFDNIEESFASAQFNITVSDGAEVKAADITFDNGIKDKASGTVNTISSGGRSDGNQIVYKAGFLSTENQFKGKLMVGTISFSYEGNTPQTITLNNLEVYRFTGNTKDGLPELKKTEESWSKTITVSRKTTEQKVADPKANPLPGKYKTNTEIVLTSTTDGAKIYYTVDGSNPTKLSTLYSKPIILNKDMNVKAFAVKEGYIDSSIMTFSYTVSDGKSDSGSSTKDKPEQPPVNTISFKDVGPEYSWATDAIGRLVARGVILGDNEGNFRPSDNVIRADFVVMITRLVDLGNKDVVKFNDVEPGQYYTDAIGKASAAGIILGVDDSNFMPLKNITRQDAFVVIYRLLNKLGKVDNEGVSISSFSDASSVAPYAQQAVSFLVGKGIIQGSNGILNPTQNITRAETAVILDRIMAMFNL